MAQYPKIEYVVEEPNHLICWRSVIGGTLIALTGFSLLTALGTAIAGYTIEEMTGQEPGGSTLLTLAGLWLGLSLVASMFSGAYFGTRLSRFVTTRIGAAQGFIIAALVYIILLVGLGNAVGGIAKGVAKAAGGAGEGTSLLAQNPVVQDALDEFLGSANLKSDPRTVAQGLLTRLVRGDTDSAKRYLAYQTGQSTTDVDAKFNDLKAKFDASLKKATEQTSRVVADAGMTLFILLLVGLIGAVVGGRVAAQANVDRPMATSRRVG